MKLWIPVLICLLYACSESGPKPEGRSTGGTSTTPLPSGDTAREIFDRKNIKPGEPIETLFTDTVTFSELDNNGDYFLFSVQKQNKSMSLVYDDWVVEKLNFLRGDTLEIQWKMDTVWIAGDGEKPQLTEWLVGVKKLKDGKVASFRKSYGKPLHYWYGQKEHYSTEFKDYIYRLVEYYIAYSDQELVKVHLKNPRKTNFGYSIENAEKRGTLYTVIGLANQEDLQVSVMQWLYFNPETRQLYEYDLAGDRLILFSKYK